MGISRSAWGSHGIFHGILHGFPGDAGDAHGIIHPLLGFPSWDGAEAPSNSDMHCDVHLDEIFGEEKWDER